MTNGIGMDHAAVALSPLSMEEIDATTNESSSKNNDYDNTTPRSIVNGNWTPWWLVSTVYMLIFVGYMGVWKFSTASAGFVLHSLLALTFVLGCTWNLFHSPDHGDWYRATHIWVGRIAMLAGCLVVFSGYYMVLLSETSLSEAAGTAFMVTGAFQVVMQFLAIAFLRVGTKNVFGHVVSVSILFYCCALLPAMNRMPQLFGFPDSDRFVILVMSIGAFFPILPIFWQMRSLGMQKKQQPSSSPSSGE